VARGILGVQMMGQGRGRRSLRVRDGLRVATKSLRVANMWILGVQMMGQGSRRRRSLRVANKSLQVANKWYRKRVA
jgi:hypothetical protein